MGVLQYRYLTHDPHKTKTNPCVSVFIGIEPKYQNLIYGISAALTCPVLLLLLICYLRPRLRKGNGMHLSRLLNFLLIACSVVCGLETDVDV